MNPKVKKAKKPGHWKRLKRFCCLSGEDDDNEGLSPGSIDQQHQQQQENQSSTQQQQQWPQNQRYQQHQRQQPLPQEQQQLSQQQKQQQQQQQHQQQQENQSTTQQQQQRPQHQPYQQHQHQQQRPQRQQSPHLLQQQLPQQQQQQHQHQQQPPQQQPHQRPQQQQQQQRPRQQQNQQQQEQQQHRQLEQQQQQQPQPQPQQQPRQLGGLLPQVSTTPQMAPADAYTTSSHAPTIDHVPLAANAERKMPPRSNKRENRVSTDGQHVEHTSLVSKQHLNSTYGTAAHPAPPSVPDQVARDSEFKQTSNMGTSTHAANSDLALELPSPTSKHDPSISASAIGTVAYPAPLSTPDQPQGSDKGYTRPQPDRQPGEVSGEGPIRQTATANRRKSAPATAIGQIPRPASGHGMSIIPPENSTAPRPSTPVQATSLPVGTVNWAATSRQTGVSVEGPVLPMATTYLSTSAPPTSLGQFPLLASGHRGVSIISPGNSHVAEPSSPSAHVQVSRESPRLEIAIDQINAAPSPKQTQTPDEVSRKISFEGEPFDKSHDQEMPDDFSSGMSSGKENVDSSHDQGKQDEGPRTISPKKEPFAISHDQEFDFQKPDEGPRTISHKEEPFEIPHDHKKPDDGPRTISPKEESFAISPDQEFDFQKPDEGPRTISPKEDPFDIPHDHKMPDDGSRERSSEKEHFDSSHDQGGSAPKETVRESSIPAPVDMRCLIFCLKDENKLSAVARSDFIEGVTSRLPTHMKLIMTKVTEGDACSTEQYGKAPVIVPCLVVTRVASCIESTMNRLATSPIHPRLLVAFYPRAKHDQTVSSSEQNLGSKKRDDIECIIDIAFDRTNGKIWESDNNHRSMDDMAEYLIRLCEMTDEGQIKSTSEKEASSYGQERPTTREPVHKSSVAAGQHLRSLIFCLKDENKLSAVARTDFIEGVTSRLPPHRKLITTTVTEGDACSTEQYGKAPVIVPCLVVTRVASCIESTMNRLAISTIHPRLLVAFYPRAKHDQTVSSSEQNLGSKKRDDIECIIDIAFDRTNGHIWESDNNHRSMDDMAEYLNRLCEISDEGQSKPTSSEDTFQQPIEIDTMPSHGQEGSTIKGIVRDASTAFPVEQNAQPLRSLIFCLKDENKLSAVARSDFIEGVTSRLPPHLKLITTKVTEGVACSTEQYGKAPVIVPCLVVTRVASCIESTMNRLAISPVHPRLLVAFYPRAKHDQTVSSSEQNLGSKKRDDIECILDIAFDRTNGHIWESENNHRSMKDMVEYLIRLCKDPDLDSTGKRMKLESHTA